MSAEPSYNYELDDHDPDDPAEILRVLPVQHHQLFLTEYRKALASADDVEHYRDLHKLLRLWRLRAIAYSDPAYEEQARTAAEAARTGNLDGWTSLEDVIANRGGRGWPTR